MTVLLDANVLIAWHTPAHVHHGLVSAWLAAVNENYATCPITQGSLVRFAVREGLAASQASRLIQGLNADPRHEFWPDDVGYADVSMVGVIGHRQVTDAYLAGLARHHDARLATLDSGLAALHRDIAHLLLK